MNLSIKTLRVIFYGLVFLLFFQLLADFVETIYAFGLLGTRIPPEIVSVLLFFSPLILLAFRRGLPRQAGVGLVVGAALMRAMEVSAGTSLKMIASGLGTGSLLVAIPFWLSQPEVSEDGSSHPMGLGLIIGLAGSILCRVAGLGTDVTLVYPWLSWIMAAGLVALAVILNRPPANQPGAEISRPASFGGIAALSLGVMGVLILLYFAFTSPGVTARWTGVDWRWVLCLLGVALGLFAAGLAWNGLARLSGLVIWLWNVLFLALGTASIWINQVRFPSVPNAYPLAQPDVSWFEQLPFFLMLLLSPVLLLDFIWLVDEIKARRPSPRQLAGGFSLGALALLIIILAQAFTTVYDYIPVVGPWFRDRFWLVFLLAGLCAILPTLAMRTRVVMFSSSVASAAFLAAVWAPLALALFWALASQPVPTPPQAGSPLRVVTYNLQQGYSVDGQRSYQAQLAVLRSLSPDIVGLEESDVARFSGGNADIVRTISQGLGMYSYYGPRTVTGTFGIALLSRYPIENPRTFFMYSTGEQTAAIEATITVQQKPFTILVTHLGNDGPMIQQQEVLERLEGQSNVIAMGDFNFEPATPQYALTVRTWPDAWVQAGSTPTAGLDPAHWIDHVFISPGLQVKSARYVSSPASDHPALVVEIAP